jgi:hypothetical protein
MGNPFLFADRFSGAVVHLTTGSHAATFTTTTKTEFHVALAKTVFRLASFLPAK